MIKKDFNYVSPTATVKEMQTEGVLCASLIQGVAFTIDEWENGSFSW